MTKRLELKFHNEEGRLTTISVDNPKYPVDPAAVKLAMDEIITQNVFLPNNLSITEISHAQVVDRTVEDVLLED
ncbi:DUF2922 domain-containing protein [Halalkalibacillus halophilus]|uniref:DUF2922 domain-containing protein n=1 Tax=Halalkalibacillus halophilus TaxID=392827 RepID=UPI0004247E8B|nr:DUF2922 domain-containing protein [Halalkalibacillus halophilus]